MKIVFFGSSKYSVIVAKQLQEKFGLALVVTSPDKIAPRKSKLVPSPVKEFAIVHNLAIISPPKLDKEVTNQISKFEPDFLVVADYGLILPKELLTLPKYVPLNVHHSMLPKYRGPAPAPFVILAGEKKSGVTIISMTEEVDGGDILAQKEYELSPDETTDSLLSTLNKLGAEILVEVIQSYINSTQKPVKQDSSKATYTHRLKKEDGFFDNNDPPDPKTLNRMIRAFYPWPGTWCQLTLHGRQFTVKFLPDHPFLVQPEGKRPLTITQFENGYPRIYEQIKPLFTQQAQS